MSDKLQKIGAILLAIAVVLLFLEQIATCYIVLAVVLGIDLYLVKEKRQTVTQWFRPKFPKIVDICLMIGLIVAFVWFHSPIVGLYFLLGSISGHLNGDW